ncbi:MAG TPA: helix-turn-helix transcriptional regulator [Pyrinomonadaceae bacterium]|jgi:transcriptional regulator with XRE-family HTH domain|nr:helix-turn-helix transcriptional regulator [Pyrinomonadaceae bacterium]
MGQRARMRQERLAEKLLQVRLTLELSQSEMLRLLGFEDVLDYKRISEYELGKSEPPLAVLLRYARVAGICVEVLIDDELDLPARLPVRPGHKIR